MRLLIAAAGLVAATSVAAHPLDGEWNSFLEECNAETDDMLTIDVDAGTIRYFESGCEIISIEAIGTQDSAWRAMLSCGFEASASERESILMIDTPFDGSPTRLIDLQLDTGFVDSRYKCEASDDAAMEPVG